jgi:hypothetical protein
MTTGLVVWKYALGRRLRSLGMRARRRDHWLLRGSNATEAATSNANTVVIDDFIDPRHDRRPPECESVYGNVMGAWAAVSAQ